MSCKEYEKVDVVIDNELCIVSIDSVYKAVDIMRAIPSFFPCRRDAIAAEEAWIDSGLPKSLIKDLTINQALCVLMDIQYKYEKL